MKHYFLLLSSLLLFACSGQPAKKTAPKTVVQSQTDTLDYEVEYLTSTYDEEFNPHQRMGDHFEGLKLLSDSLVFSRLHAKLLPTLNKFQKAYFASKPQLELIYQAKGNLFDKGTEDATFVVYDKKRERVAIIACNVSENKYLELFRDVKVGNGLKDADCNYGQFGTLDYILGGELVDLQDVLLKDPNQLTEYFTPVVIGDISKDENFILDEGCFSPMIDKKDLSKSLGIATSSVYNNWEALKYDKKRGAFIIYYGQAFAD